MKQSLELKLGQRLTMTPQLQQAIKLLQLSALDLKTEIQQALEENPLLEESDGAGLEAEPSTETGDGGVESEPMAEDPGGEDSGDEYGEQEAAMENPVLSDENTSAVSEETEIADWSEHFESHITGISSDTPAQEMDDRNSAPTTLRSHLEWQMCMVPFSETDYKIAIALIDAVDEDGYLGASIEDIVTVLAGEDIHVEADEVEATLHQIQNFDPPGVCARDLRECLLIQLRQFDHDSSAIERARQLVEHHFDLLCGRDFPQIRRLMKLDEEALNQTVKFIQGLHPRPGNAISPANPSYVVPDVIVKKVKNEWRTELNTSAFPHLRINNTYQALLSGRKNGEETKYIQNHLQEARWFIKSLSQRNETLLRVAKSIVERQKEFFENGEQSMKPMVLHDIAEALDLHESTISRATTQKYMLAPTGIFELKFFFSSHVSTVDGGTCSSTVIRKRIKEFVAEESPSKPISDSKMAKLLSQQGINVARRTVAKYRENMNIPSSSQRKTIM